MRSFLCRVLFALFLFISPAQAGDIIPDGLGHYGVVLDVLFTYEPDDENLARWKSVLTLASEKIHRATSGEVFIKKVNLIICPFEIEGGKTVGSADITIRQGDGTSQAIGTLSGSRPGGVTFYEKGRTIQEDGEAMAHELAHYFFEIYDEYKKPEKSDDLEKLFRYEALGPSKTNFQKLLETLAEEGVIHLFDYKEDVLGRLKAYIDANGFKNAFSTDLKSNTAITELDFQQFCTDPPDVGENEHRACIMDSGKQVIGEMIRDDYYGLLCDSHNHATGVASFIEDEQVMLWSRNGQSYLTGKSCATWAKERWLKNYTIFLKLPGTIVSHAAPEIEFEEKSNCSETVVLLLDKSGSMAGARIANLKAAAMGLIDSLDDNTKLGIVWFDSQPQAAVGIQELKDSRVLAKQAIAAINAGGGTNIGFGLGVAYQQLLLLRDPDKERPEEIIYLITDGESSDDPSNAVATIKADGVKINSVSIGSDTDLSFLQEVSSSTGGQFFYSPDDKDIVRVVTQGTTQSLEGYTLVSEEAFSAPFNDISVNVDGFVGNMLLQLELTDFATAEIDENDFALISPDGQETGATVRFTSLSESRSLVTFELKDPAGGLFTVRLPSSALRLNSAARTLLLVQSSEIRMFAGLSPRITEYPNPIIVSAGIEGNLGIADGYTVTAKVRRPDASIVSLELRDNGSRSNGDDLAEDGVFSASFEQFNGEGTYSVEIVADNSDNSATIGGGMHGTKTNKLFGPFVRQKALTFEVKNYTTPPSGTLALSEPTIPTPDQVFSSRYFPKGAVTLGSFHAKTGDGQGIIIEELALSLSSDLVKLAHFSEFQVYIDGNSDGMIDFVGEYSRPIAQIKATIKDGTIELRDGIALPAGADFDLLIEGIFNPEISVSQENPEPINASWPLAAVALSGLFVAIVRRRRALSIACALGATGFLIIGCGGNAQNFVFTSPNAEQHATPILLESGTVASQISLGSVTAKGIIDGQTISVTLPDKLIINGPPITIETQRVLTD